MIEYLTDTFRLLAVPAFGYAAWQDLEDRRVPNALWPPLLAIGLVCLGVDLLTHSSDGRATLLVGLGVGLSIAGLAYVVWLLGGIGGADVKALLALAVVYPTGPFGSGPFVLAVLANTAAVVLVVPVALVAINLASGDVSPLMFGARVRDRPDLASAHGSVLHSGLDLDALRAYLQWRGVGLDELTSVEDWQAEAFVDDAQTYGADAATVRRGLEAVAERERVWINPGLPLLVFLFVGLLGALAIGNVLVMLF